MSYSGYVHVASVYDGGSAAAAGIKASDIIYSINGDEFSTFAALTEILTKYKVGDTVTVKILRPTIALSSASNYNSYIRSCEEIELTLTFIEFNPNNF
jgi:S1-C subfamily serine protease